MPATAYPHIVRDAQGHLRIEGAHYKVLVLLEEHVRAGRNAEELVEAHELLTLAQAHSLLAFYYDNKAELDEALRLRDEEFEQIYRETYNPELQERWRRRAEEWRRTHE